MAKNSLLSRLRSAFRTGENFSTELSSGRSLSLPDAADICAFLTEQVDIVPLLKTEPWGEYHVPLYHLVMPFQDAEDEVHDYLGEHGLPQLARLCDLGLAEAEAPGHPFTMLAKMFALYGYDPGIARVAAIARRYPDEYMLSVSFQIYGDERHPDGPVLIEMLRNPLPGGFALVLTLDLANALCRQQRLERHPFDTAAGHKLLEDGWQAAMRATSVTRSARRPVCRLSPPTACETISRP